MPGRDLTKKREYLKKYFQSEAGKAALLRYRQSEKGKKTMAAVNRRYKQSPKGKEGNNRRGKRYRGKYPERAKAREALNKAILAGIIKRPDCCDTCRMQGKIHAHHHLGYSWEHRFDVMWLCHSCHMAIHFSSVVESSAVDLELLDGQI